MTLTPKQQKIFFYIEEYLQENGYAPTQGEIASHFKLKSLGSVQQYLSSLEDKGYLKKSWNAKRSLQISLHSTESVSIPMAGIVAAGRPIEAIEQHETLDVPKSLLTGGENFGLQVRGDSMIEDGIHDGDFVIIRKQTTAEKGQTVVAMIDGEATVKKFYRTKEGILLHPAHPTMKPIEVKSGQGFQILGIVVGLIRKYHS